MVGSPISPWLVVGRKLPSTLPVQSWQFSMHYVTAALVVVAAVLLAASAAGSEDCAPLRGEQTSQYCPDDSMLPVNSTTVLVTDGDLRIAQGLAELARAAMPAANNDTDTEATRERCQALALKLLCLQEFPACPTGSVPVCASLRAELFDVCQRPGMVLYDEDVLEVVFPLEGYSNLCPCTPEGTICEVPTQPPSLAPTQPQPPAPSAPPLVCERGKLASSVQGSTYMVKCMCEPGWVGVDCSCRECQQADLVVDISADVCDSSGGSRVTIKPAPGTIAFYEPMEQPTIVPANWTSYNSSVDPAVCCIRTVNRTETDSTIPLSGSCAFPDRNEARENHFT